MVTDLGLVLPVGETALQGVLDDASDLQSLAAGETMRSALPRSPVRFQRTFRLPDQERFAILSGDRNPIHMDQVFARRTAAGAPVVHGIHLLLWSLDCLARVPHAALPGFPLEIASTFETFVYVGEAVDAVLETSELGAPVMAVSVNGQIRFRATIRAAGQPARPVSATGVAAPPSDILDRPADPEIATMGSLSGVVPFAGRPEIIGAEFPALADWIGCHSVAGLASTSYVVGMVVPGLHSIFVRVAVRVESRAGTGTSPSSDESLRYRVTSARPRLRTVSADVAGGALSGSITALVRREPVEQPGFASLKSSVAPGAFAGQSVLVVGGSRGLGEMTAKLLAAGGAHVVITYALGAGEAEKVRQDIVAGGGSCKSRRLNALEPIGAQLPSDPDFTHAYYFATPPVLSKADDVFSSEQLGIFTRFYVEGFWNLAKALQRSNPALSLFYPSTVFVQERPRGMTEYAMAKLAGEALCADINRFMGPLHVTVERLPRVRTDLTAALIDVGADETLSVMLPIVTKVQARASGG